MSFFGEPPAILTPYPANEAERLRATRAYEILDTPPEPQFDAITRVAAALFKVPVALISLMDGDRLWFKSRLGLDVPQLDRKLAFCAHAICHAHEQMVIEDLAVDPRFAEHPLVAGGPQVRFYASAPLVDPDGLALGTVAILDTQPRSFGAADRAALADLAVAVMTALEGHRRNHQLRRSASTDYLTGAANRAAFDRALKSSVERCTGGGEPFALLTLDLDDFKHVNDTLGHAAGDAVLREVARRMRALSRAGDLVARVGGDEFALLIAAPSDPQRAAAVADEMLLQMDDPVPLPDGSSVKVTGSLGVACCPQDAADPSGLLEQADRALYRAKHRVPPRTAATRPLVGRGVPAEAHDHAAADRCGACAEGIRLPFAFSMAFQPIIDSRNHSVFAYEALVRGPAGEGAGWVLDKVTARNRYAFDQSCRTTAIRLAAELGLPDMGASLSINFIPGAMYEPRNCIRATLAAARKYGFPLDRLIFEVTESERVNDEEKLREIFAVYTEHGFRTAIDDFGAGYSGLSLLSEFHPRIIKLDMGLIRGIDADRARRAIVRGVISICAEMGVQVIAEGIETREEFRVLADLGVTLHQGYLFARPAFEALPDIHYPDLSGS